MSDLQFNLLRIWDKYNPHKGKQTDKPTETRSFSITCLDDISIINKCYKNEKFRALFEGRWETLFSSQSEADVALCTIIAFWANRDPGTIERVFEASKLAERCKWTDRADYRDRTIAQAIEYCTEDLDEFKARKDRERREAIERYFYQQ